MKDKHHPPTAATILAQAIVSDNIDKFHPERFPVEVRNQIAFAQSRGQRVVAVYWPSGEFAVMPCEPHSDMPSSENVIKAYYGCVQAARHVQEAK